MERKRLSDCGAHNSGRGNIGRSLLVLLLLSMALGLIVYPFAANYLFENRAASVVSAAKQAVQRAGDAVWKEALLEAEKDRKSVV